MVLRVPTTYIVFRRTYDDITNRTENTIPVIDATTWIQNRADERSGEYNFSLSHSGLHVPLTKRKPSLQFTSTEAVVMFVIEVLGVINGRPRKGTDVKK